MCRDKWMEIGDKVSDYMAAKFGEFSLKCCLENKTRVIPVGL